MSTLPVVFTALLPAEEVNMPQTLIVGLNALQPLPILTGLVNEGVFPFIISYNMISSSVSVRPNKL